jgi:hypothetical protein
MDSARPSKCAVIKGTLIRTWPFISLGVIALLHITKVVNVDGYALGLLILTFLPVVLKTITTYFESFKIGKDGVEAKAFADKHGKTAAELEERILAYNSNEPPVSPFPFHGESRAILATLWHYQKRTFGEDSLQRWGFGIGLGALDFRAFQNGLIPLITANYVHQDQRGISYLTNEGVQFCKEQTAILDADGPHYTQFAPVPNS